MTQSPSGSPTPDLSELMDKSAEEWSAPEIQSAARSAMRLHAPDREPLTWIKRFGVLPWLHRNDAVCLHCGGTYPCITHRYATQLLSAGRVTMSRADRSPADADTTADTTADENVSWPDEDIWSDENSAKDPRSDPPPSELTR